MRDTPVGTERETPLAEGVRALDHTADVGLDVAAPSLEALFDRAAHGLVTLLRGDDRAAEGGGHAARVPQRTEDPDPEHPTRAAGTTTKRLAVAAADRGALLVAWLRELLWLHESTGFAYHSASFETLTATTLAAVVRGAVDERAPAREIKGVTYHGLEVGRAAGGWHATVIFDV